MFTDAGGVITTGYTAPAYTDAGGNLLLPAGPSPSGWASSAFGVALFQGTASFAPIGWESSDFGSPTVYNLLHIAEPAGLASAAAVGEPIVFNLLQIASPAGVASTSAAGTHTVYNLHQFVFPPGCASTAALGTPVVYNFNQDVYPDTIPPPSQQVSPDAFVFDPLQYVEVAGIVGGAIPAALLIAFYYRELDFSGSGIAPGAVGTQFIAHRVRTLEVPFIYTNEFGEPEVESFLNVPDTWTSSVVSSSTMVSHAIREIAHWASTPTSAVARPTVFHRNRFLSQGGWPSLQIPPPVVFNLTQYVAAGEYYVNSPPQFVGVPTVQNRNREIGPSGFYRGLFGRRTDTFVANAARAIAPLGIASLTWGEGTFIAHRIRYVSPEAWDGLRMTRWGVVYNDAFLVAPLSLGDTSLFGRPDPVLNLRRTVRHYNVSDMSAFGTPFVAPRVRTLSPRDIRAPNAGLPVVRLNPQPVAPPGIGPLPFGHVVLYEFHRIARPMSFNVFRGTRIGEPWIRNRNQVVRPHPVVRDEYGRPNVRNRDQYVVAGGLNSFAQGAYLVEFRTKLVSFGGIAAPAISLIHRVRKSIADPPGAQVVFPPSFYVGDEARPGIVPAPAFHHPTIFPEGWASARFGAISVRGTGFFPSSIVRIDTFGTPLFVHTQIVYTSSFGNIDPAGQVADPQLSPHTIYAPFGDTATEQARHNNPAVAPPHVIGLPAGEFNNSWSLGGGWPWFGLPEVSTSPRAVQPGPLNAFFPAFGLATVDLRLRYLRPTPIRGPRFGPVIILNVPQHVGFNEDNPGVSDGVFGTADVSHRPAYPPTISPPSLPGAVFGDSAIELFNRSVSPSGRDMASFGTAMVGYPRTYTLSVGSATLWGTAIVEYLNREVSPTGWDSLSLIDESLSSFAYRMRVTRREVPHPISAIPPSSGVGTPTVSFRLREVVAQPIRPPRPGLARIAMTVAPLGWGDVVFGDIDEWEAGKVKPHGDDMLVFPTPRMGRGVTLSVGDTSSVGAPRMAWAVYTFGMPPVGFAGPAITDEHGCSRRVLVAWPIQPPSFPQPVVTQ